MASSEHGLPGPAPMPGPARYLAAALAEDLTAVLDRPVSATDLVGRRDGAMPTLIGALSVASAPQRAVACRLLREWVTAGTAGRGQDQQLWGPSTVEVTGLQAGEMTLVPGLTIQELGKDVVGERALELLLPTVAVVTGALCEVIVVEDTEACPVPGWVARLRLLAGLEELGPAEVAADLGTWVVEAHQLAGTIYVPDARDGSLWSALSGSLRAQALSALASLGEDCEGEGELDRRGSADFTTLVDLEHSATLQAHHSRNGNVLQVVRLPRRRDGLVDKARVLLAPRGTG